MKKVININFQGRVIPIEETAYDMLKQYVESLRRFFHNEEGRDEIINDIEGRIAELFGDNLKKGSTCITDVDVNAIIDSMGRPEDFDADEAKVQSQLGAESYTTGATTEESEPVAKGRLYRDDQDKILGGVCSGLAHYLRIDPAIIRILFAVITFGGFGSGFLIYILMWAILPAKSLEKSAIRKRLFRNPEDKVFAGVASGVAAYFNIAVWIPRLIFAFPLVIGVVVSIFRNIFWQFDPFPSIFFGSFGSTFFIVYLILWIVIPEANSASEKLEMRGEKVDLNTIKNTIQEDLQGFKGRAEKWGKEVGARAQEFGKEFGSTVGATGQTFTSEVGGAARRGGSRVFNAIGVIFKAFFLFIAGVIAFALSIALFMLLFRGVNIFPLKDFIITGFWPNTLALITLVFFIAVPIIALVTWVIRRVMKVRSRNNYLGYIFGGLWTIGLISAIILAATVAREFRRTASSTETVAITQPATGKLIVSVQPPKDNFYTYEMFDDNSDAPMLSKNEDSLLLNTITIKFAKSLDSSFHVYAVKISKGTTPVTAEDNLKSIAFEVKQTDSILYLPSGFAISRSQRFHNQKIAFVIEVPVGKKVYVDEKADQFDWFDVETNNRRRNDPQWSENWNNLEGAYTGVEYIMTVGGLDRTDKKDIDHDEINDDQESRSQSLREIEEQQKELDRQKKELLQGDSTPATVNPPAAPKTKTIKKTVKDSTSVAEVMKDNTPDVSTNALSSIMMKFTR